MSKAAVVYWSGTGNTSAMANAMAEGMRGKGLETEVFEVSAIQPSDISAYDRVAFGCPSMGDEVLEEGEFEPFFEAVESSLGGKKIALFGSYGWGDGQWMRDWVKRVEAGPANLFDEGLIMQDAPDEGECKTYGERFAEY